MVDTQTLISTDLVQALLTQQAEVGVALSPVSHPNLEIRPIYENHLVAVLPATPPLANQTEVHASDLAVQDLIGYGSEPPFGRLIAGVFGGNDLPRLAVEDRLTHRACHLVYTG